VKSFNLKPSSFGFLVGTRAALAFGAGLLVASRIPEDRRKQIGLALLGLGVATTVPAVRMLRRSRTQPAPEPAREPVNGVSFNGAYSEFGFARQM
jgi:hypothetical protein